MTTEMETDAAIEASGRVFVAEPDVDALAGAIIAAMRSDACGDVDLADLTWDGRASKLDAIYERVTLRQAA